MSGNIRTGRRSIDNPDKTLLDEFAIAAMVGILADPEDHGCLPDMTCAQSVAHLAYHQAIAMMSEKKRLEAL